MKVLTPTVLTYLKVVILVALVPAIVGFVIVLAERRFMGFMQARLGPNRVGPKGTLQGLADLIKLVTKEDLTPARAEKAVHFLAPVLAVIPALTALAVIPFGPSLRLSRHVSTPLYVTDINIGLLFLLAITSIGVYGIILGGWASNNKYSLLGGLRSAAQLVSYEVPMSLALVAVLLMARSLSLVEIVQRQERIHLWFVFPGLVSFFLYFVSGVAETNRSPFDLPEAESELVSGFNTEYSGVKFAFFFLGEYTGMIIISCVAVTVFFGGWLPPCEGARVPARDSALRLVSRQGRLLPLLLHLVPFDLPALPLRPAHGARVEVDDSGLAGKYPGRGARDPGHSGTHQRALRARLDFRRCVCGPLAPGEAPPGAHAPRPARGGARRCAGDGVGETFKTMALKKWLDKLTLLDLFDGLSVTGRHFFQKKVTIQYPEQKKIPSDRFRGMFRLDEERCIKCTLCAIECPIDIIYIDWHSEKNEAGKSVKVLDRFDVDLKRCMFCQLCEEACPTVPKSIWLTTKTYEMAAYDRNESLYLDIRKLTDWQAAPNVKPFTVVEQG